MISNMKARLVLRARDEVGDGAFTEYVIWQVPEPLRGSGHLFKYRIAYIEDGVCVIRYDNEAGKGDHKHVGDLEFAYTFRGLRQLFLDFDLDVEAWRRRT